MFVFRGSSNEELLQKGIAPIERTHWLETPSVLPPTTPPLQPQISPVESQSPAPKKEKPSRRQLKKDRKERLAKSLCVNFIKGRCLYGDKCKFSHDVESFQAQWKPELPGRCPFSEQDCCPYGILCKWASSHSPSDAPSGPTQGSAGAGLETSGSDLHTASLLNAVRAAKTDENDMEAHLSKHLELPVLPKEGPTTNILGKDLKTALRRREHIFAAADRITEEVGSNVTFKKGPRPKAPALPQPESTENGGPHTPPEGNASQTDSLGALQLEPGPAKRQKTDVAPSQQAALGVQESAGGSPAQLHSLEIQSSTANASGTPAAAAQIDRLAEEGGAEASGNVSQGLDGESAAPSKVDRCQAGGQILNGSLEDLEQPEAEPLFDVRDRRGKVWAAMHTETPLKQQEKRHLDFQGKLYLAPLTTVGNLPFRRICKGLGADITCGEMALATCLLQGQASEWALLKRHPCEDLFGVQVCGSHADSMVRCAQLLEESTQVDFVDINMGCPIDLICNKGAGSSLLQKPQRMEQIVRGMSRMLSCPLTIKVRRGYADGNDVAHQLLPKAASWGAAAATLHGRSREQRYSRLADWDYIGKCAEAAAPLPLVGNGDVFSFTDYEEHMAACPQLATTMLARGALIKPWLFTEIKERRHWDISASERLELLKQFCSAGLMHWGSDEKGVETTRRFLLEWLSFTCRYIPVGLLEVIPQRLNWRPPFYGGRSDLETLMAQQDPASWVAISKMLLGPTPAGFSFTPKHKSNSYAMTEKSMSLEDAENG